MDFQLRFNRISSFLVKNHVINCQWNHQHSKPIVMIHKFIFLINSGLCLRLRRSIDANPVSVCDFSFRKLSLKKFYGTLIFNCSSVRLFDSVHVKWTESVQKNWRSALLSVKFAMLKYNHFVIMNSQPKFDYSKCGLNDKKRRWQKTVFPKFDQIQKFFDQTSKLGVWNWIWNAANRSYVMFDTSTPIPLE